MNKTKNAQNEPNVLLETKKSVSERVTVDRLLLVCFALLVTALVAARSMPEKLGGYLGAAVIQIMIFFIPSYFYVRMTFAGKRARQTREELGLRGISPNHIFLIISAALLCICLSLVFDMLFGGIKDTANGFSLYGIFTAGGDSGELAPLYLSVVYALVPAICEEFLFRGIIFSAYKKHGMLSAALISSFFFALISFKFSLLPSAFLTGLVLSALLFITESVSVCIAVHLLYNLFGIFMRTNVSNYYVYSNNNTLLLLSIVFVILFSAAVFCFESARNLKLLAKRGKEPPTLLCGGIKRTLLTTGKNVVSPCSVVCIVVYVALCVLGILGIF